MSIHDGISCDSCHKINFSGHRYKCLICNDFDLCSICYDRKSNLSFQIHSIDHPMQLILTLNDYEHIYFGCTRTKYSSISLICPLCNKNGFSLDFLIKHINEKHVLLKYSVLCPICFIRENNLSKHLQQHIDENLIFNSKNRNLNEKEFKFNQQSLLEKFLNNYQNKPIHQQRYLFIHCLLTNLLNKDI